MTLFLKKPFPDIFGVEKIAVCGDSPSYKIWLSKSQTKSVKYAGNVAAHSSSATLAI